MLPKTIAGVVALGKIAHACKDVKSFDICIDAFRNKECGGFSGCDRTCGTCNESDCYDRIPANDNYLIEFVFPASSIWPNFANDGGNSLPRIATGDDFVNSNFPFDDTTISTFCKDVFDNGLCNKEEVVYADKKLPGVASDYCAFTCGKCKVSVERGECWRQHNANMQYLSELNAGTDVGWESEGNSWGDNGWDDASWEEPSWDFGENSEENEWGNSEENAWESLYSFSRKRRSSTVDAMSRSEILAEAVESMIFPKLKDALPLNARNRRDWGFGDWGFGGVMTGQQQFGDHEETQRVKEEMAQLDCFDQFQNDCAEGGCEELTEEAEEGEEEEEEAGEDPVERVRQQRFSTDHAGMKNWVADNSPEGTKIANGVCDNYHMDVEEAVSEMELAYTCHITCESGAAFVDQGEELVSLEEGLRMICSKENYRQFNKPADCTSPQYCVGSSCHRIVCINNEAEESEGTSEFGDMIDMFAGFFYEEE